MNDDDWFINVLRDHAYQRSVGSPMNTQQIYDMLKNIDIYSKKDTDMAYTYSRNSWYQDTRGDEVATAVLEAYANGVDFETLIQKNRVVRQYWYQIQSEKARAEKARAAQLESDRKLAEKRALEKAKKDEVLAKLTDEELEAFGFMKNKKKVTKR